MSARQSTGDSARRLLHRLLPPQLPQLTQHFCTPVVLEPEGGDQRKADQVKGEVGICWVTGAAGAMPFGWAS